MKVGKFVTPAESQPKLSFEKKQSGGCDSCLHKKKETTSVSPRVVSRTFVEEKVRETKKENGSEILLFISAILILLNLR